jgi:hypothetical protein
MIELVGDGPSDMLLPSLNRMPDGVYVWDETRGRYYHERHTERWIAEVTTYRLTNLGKDIAEQLSK